MSNDPIYHSFLHFYHLDHSNAAIHMSPVRYSPITFELAQIMVHRNSDPAILEVLRDKGLYPEDRGRVEMDRV